MRKIEENQVKQRNKGLNILIVILLVITIVASSIGLYAWAKYTTSKPGDASAPVAKWYFNLKTGEYTPNGPQLMAMTRTDGKEHVEEGKLAPGTSGVLPIIVDITGTEVDLIYDVTITITNCPKNIEFTPRNSATTIITKSGDGKENNPRVTTIKIQNYVKWSENATMGEHDETITWEWLYETGTGEEIEANDVIDTEDSKKDATVTITATGTEVMSKPINFATITYGEGETLKNGDTIEIYEGETVQLNVEEGAEGVEYSTSSQETVTIETNGTIKAVKVGETVITITGKDSGSTMSVKVKVLPGTSAKVGEGEEQESIILTAKNAGSYYGSVVRNYKVNNEEYQLFFIDYNGKYGEKGGIYLKKKNNEANINGTNSSTTALTLSTKTDPELEEMKIKEMNPLWAEEKGTITQNNEEAVAWLCDTEQWKKYKILDKKQEDTEETQEEVEEELTEEDLQSKVKYAIGGPSYEMYVDSYNEAVKAYNTANSMSISTLGEPTLGTYGYNFDNTSRTILVGKNSMYTTNIYWLASPSYNFSNYVIDARSSFFNNRTYNDTRGLAPLVCLSSDFPLELE